MARTRVSAIPSGGKTERVVVISHVPPPGFELASPRPSRAVVSGWSWKTRVSHKQWILRDWLGTQLAGTQAPLSSEPMIAVLSPAKKLDFDPISPEVPSTKPELLKETSRLMQTARALSVGELKQLMKLSQSLAELNHQRFQDFSTTKKRGSKQAALAFNGDTYIGLRAPEFSPKELEYAQDHVRILSGLYGLLRPLDLIHPYRLEMGTRLKTERGNSLYDFWGSKVAQALDKQAQLEAEPLIVNLSSKEYFTAVEGQLKTPVLTCTFKEVKDGKAKVIGFCAKRARGMMARFIVKHQVQDPKQLQRFNETGYQFQKSGSSAQELVFHRKAS